jgi:hypothetical protein
MHAHIALAAALVALSSFASASLAAGESQEPSSPSARRPPPSASAPSSSGRSRAKPSLADPLRWDAVDPRNVERKGKKPSSPPQFPAERQ